MNIGKKSLPAYSPLTTGTTAVVKTTGPGDVAQLKATKSFFSDIASSLKSTVGGAGADADAHAKVKNRGSSKLKSFTRYIADAKNELMVTAKQTQIGQKFNDLGTRISIAMVGVPGNPEETKTSTGGSVLKGATKAAGAFKSFVGNAAKDITSGHFKATNDAVKVSYITNKYCKLDPAATQAKIQFKDDEIAVLKKDISKSQEETGTAHLTPEKAVDLLRDQSSDPSLTKEQRATAAAGKHELKLCLKRIAKRTSDIGELNKISNMNSAQKVNYELDKHLDTTAKMANSVWSVALLAGSFSPAAPVVLGLSGAVFLAAKGLKMANEAVGAMGNQAVKMSAQAEIAKLTKTINPEILADIHATLQANGGQLTTKMIGDVKAKLAVVTETLGQPATDKLLKSLLSEHVASEAVVNNLIGLFTDAVNVSTWAFSAGVVGAAMSTLVQGGDIGSVMGTAKDSLLTTGSEGGLLDSQVRYDTSGASNQLIGSASDIASTTSAGALANSAGQVVGYRLETDVLDKIVGTVKTYMRQAPHS